jgi:spore maturation protein CgeB
MCGAMRALLSTINFDHPQTGMLDGFEKVLGAENVRMVETQRLPRHPRPRGTPDQILLYAAREFQPDWIWLQLQEIGKISARGIASLSEALPHCVVTHWMGDCRKEIEEYLASICKATHATFISSVGQIPMYKAAGASVVHYVQIGLDWAEDVAAPEKAPPFSVPDVVICANWYPEILFPGTPAREAAVKALMNAGIRVGVVGNDWPSWIPETGRCHVKQQIHVWRAAKVCLNVNHFNDIELYYSDRQLIAMASGRPLVCHYVPGLEREFENWKHLVWYKEPNELVDSVQRLLGDESLRRRIGQAGKAEVIANHTWEARIRSLVPLIEQIRPE